MAKMESGSGNAGHAQGASDAGRAQGASDAGRAQGASDAGRAQGASDSDTGLIALLIQINKALHRRTSEELLGMRLKQFLLLGYVGDRGAVSQQELETGLVMDANSVVLLLNETEAAGWSVRKRDPADRRRHMVELTQEGRLAVERAEKAREGIEDEVLSDLSAEERKALRKLLKRVLAGLLRVPAESHSQA
jgi:DNA-binding MarR family transcriptional regulator